MNHRSCSLRHALCACVALFLLYGCGNESEKPTPVKPPVSEPEIPTMSPAELADLEPAEDYQIPLADLGLSADASKAEASGAIAEASIRNGILRFSTAADAGVAQQAVLIVSGSGKTVRLHATIKPARSIEIAVHQERNEQDVVPPDPPALLVSGFGPGNTVDGAPLRFVLKNPPTLDLKKHSKAYVRVAEGDIIIPLEQFWEFNPSDGSFTIAGDALKQLLDTLPAGELEFSVNLVSEDFEFAEAYDFFALKPSATLSGKLVTPGGVGAQGLGGRRMLLKGYNSNLRRVATVDANGTFAFPGVIPDTYQLTLSDLDNPYGITIGVPVYPGSTQVDVTLIYQAPSAAPSSLSPTAGGARATQPFVGGTSKQNGKPPPPRSTQKRSSARKVGPTSGATSSDDGTKASFVAQASEQDKLVATPIAFTVPVGTRSVGVKVTVFTDEYPEYTTTKSIYDDIWAYNVTGLPGASMAEAGSVNQSHVTKGTVTKTACVDVSAQAKSSPLTVSGSVSATNIADSDLPTVTTVELSLNCAGLKVSSAKFASPNAVARPVIAPVTTTRNLPGPYLSLPQSAPLLTHTVPLEIRYEPASATITEVTIGFSSEGGDPVYAEGNLLSQNHNRTAGVIRFPALVIPQIPGAAVNAQISVTVRLRGSVDGTEAVSDPAEGGTVSFLTSTAFVPLYLAHNEAALATPARRYGVRDVGGDSWATRQTIDWLLERAYRFDDISGQHIAQFPVTQFAYGRSVLGHQGHSDGQQLDLRYADGQGGYADGLGGAGAGSTIHTMINAAAAEVASNSASRPNLGRLQAWIRENRAMMETEAAAAATRTIYIGPTFISNALVEGRFNANPQSRIPNIDPWTVPAKVRVSGDDHLSHWHISLTAHP